MHRRIQPKISLQPAFMISSHSCRRIAHAVRCFGWICPLLAVVLSARASTKVATSARFDDVNAAVAAAQRGDTVTVPAGSASWGANTLKLTKGIRLVGAGRDQTIITT